MTDREKSLADTIEQRGGRIVFRYLDVESGSDGHAYGGSASLGIERPRGTDGLEYFYVGLAFELRGAIL